MRIIKTYILLLITTIILSCSNSNNEENINDNTNFNKFEIAVLVESGVIDDDTFNQSVWEGASKYAKDNGISCQYYKVVGGEVDSYIETTARAIRNGAKLVIMPGYKFVTALYRVQDIYTNTHFIILDGIPQDGTNIKISDNVHSIIYAEEQAGFLAGYAIVKDGYTNLGVLGGMEIPSVKRFGYGFVQGADYAANILNKDNITIRYSYLGNFFDTLANEEIADSWYKDGIEVIFVPAGEATDSVIRAAEENNGFVVGVDTDQSKESKTVITSAMKMLRESVYIAVRSYYRNRNFAGRQTALLDAKINGIGLPMNTSRFRTFTKDNYNDIYQILANGYVKILKDDDVSSVNELPLKRVKVNYQK